MKRTNLSTGYEVKEMSERSRASLHAQACSTHLDDKSTSGGSCSNLLRDTALSFRSPRSQRSQQLPSALHGRLTDQLTLWRTPAETAVSETFR